MDRFKEMQVFVRIVERGSFSLAAEDLAIPRATVSNVIKRLEARLGIRLLDRTTRQLNLTHDGDAYYHRCVRLLSDLDELESSISNRSPKGLLKVNLQGTLAQFFVMPKLDTFLQQYPDISLHIAEDDRFIDLVGEGVDCVLRAGSLADSSLVAKPLASLEQVTVASPRYIKQNGLPSSLSELKQHWAVGYSLDANAKPSTLDFMVKKECQSVTLSTLVSVASADLYTAAAKTGLGLIQVPRYRIENAIERGELVLVLEQYPPPTMPVAVLYPQRRHIAARTRVFIQWLDLLFNERA